MQQRRLCGMNDQSGKDLKRIYALGPYVQDLGLLGLDVDYHEDFRFDSRALWSIVMACVNKRISGQSVLDVGCNSGLFSLLLKRQGAGHVRALDVQSEYIDQANALADYLDEADGLHFEVGSIFNREKYSSPYDIVLALGLLYHLKDPFGAISRLAALSTNILLLETETNSPYLDPKDSEFIQNRYRSDATNWWLPGVASIRDALNEEGFLFVYARPFQEGRTGTHSYSLGFSEGMVQHGSRWFFAAYKNDPKKAPFENIEATWQPHLFPVSEKLTDNDEPSGKNIQLRFKPDIQEQFLCRLEFFRQDDTEQPIAIWQQVIPSEMTSKTLSLNVSTKNLQSGVYVPVVSLFRQNQPSVAIDRIVLRPVVISRLTDKTDPNAGENFHRWLKNGIECTPSFNKPVIDSIRLLDKNGKQLDSVMEFEDFQVAVNSKSLRNCGLLRSEIVITDQDDNLITLLTSDRFGLFKLDEDEQDSLFRLSNNHLATGSYRLQCILYGTGTSGLWQVRSEPVCLYIIGEGTCDEVLLPFWEFSKIGPSHQKVKQTKEGDIGIFFKDVSTAAASCHEGLFAGKPAGQTLLVAQPQGHSKAFIHYELYSSGEKPRRLCLQNIPISFIENTRLPHGCWQICLSSRELPLGAGTYQEKYSLLDAQTLQPVGVAAFREFQVLDTIGAPIGIFSPRIQSLTGVQNDVPMQRAGQASIDLGNVSLMDASEKPTAKFQSGDLMRIQMEMHFRNPEIRPELEIEFTDDQYTKIMTCRSSEDGVTILGNGPATIQLIISHLPLLPGNYFLRVKVWDHGFSEALQPPEVQSMGDHFFFEVTGEMQTGKPGLCLFVEDQWEDI